MDFATPIGSPVGSLKNLDQFDKNDFEQGLQNDFE